MTQLDVLRLFRDFVLSNATQWKIGANRHSMWILVAETLGADNDKAPTTEEYKEWIYVE